MMGNENYKLDAALVGAGSAALFWWAENERDRNDQIRNNKLDIRDVSQQLNDLKRSGDWIRLQAPSVRDAIVGLAAATPTSLPASTVPVITNTVYRPDLSSGNNIPSIQWPPTVGPYDSAGRTNSPGELALAFHVLTYQEPRAWNQGLTLSKAPTGESLLQVFLAAQGLATTVTELRMSLGQYQQAWRNLFTGAGSPLQPAVDAHQDIAHGPQLAPGSMHPVITGVAPQPVNTAGPTTDATQRWAVNMNAGTIASGSNLFSIAFNQPYRYRDASGLLVPFVPLCVSSEPTKYEIINVSASGFTVRNLTAISAGAATTFPVNIIVVPGVPTA